jgi:hypothetical protein
MDAVVCAAFSRRPETFTRRAVCDALGDAPERDTLGRALQDPIRTGALRIASRGEGRRATTCYKTGVDPSPARR